MSPYSLVYKQIIWIINLSCRDWKKEKKSQWVITVLHRKWISPGTNDIINNKKFISKELNSKFN